MMVLFRSRYIESVRWKVLVIERLHQAFRYLQKILAMNRQAEAPALIPIRAVQPPVNLPRHRRTWRD